MPFDLIVPRLESRENNTLMTRSRTGVTIGSWVLGDDYFPQRFSPPASAEGGVVFAGFGITAPSIDHDDYAESDATGKVVLLLTHEPGEYDPQSKFDRPDRACTTRTESHRSRTTGCYRCAVYK